MAPAGARLGAAVLVVAAAALVAGAHGQEVELLGEEEHAAALPHGRAPAGTSAGKKPSVWVKTAPTHAARAMARTSAKRATFATPLAKARQSGARATKGKKSSPAKEEAKQGAKTKVTASSGDKTRGLIKGVMMKKKPCKHKRMKRVPKVSASTKLINRTLKKAEKKAHTKPHLIRKVMKRTRKKPCKACQHAKVQSESTLIQKVMQKPRRDAPRRVSTKKPGAKPLKGRALIRAVMKKKPCKDCKHKKLPKPPSLIKRVLKKKKPCKKSALIRKVIKQKPCTNCSTKASGAQSTKKKKSPKVQRSRNVKETVKNLGGNIRKVKAKMKALRRMNALGVGTATTHKGKVLSLKKQKGKLRALKKRLWSTRMDLVLAKKIRRLESKLRLPLRRNSDLYKSEVHRLRRMKKKLAATTKRVLLP